MEMILERCASCSANITLDKRDFGNRLRCWSCGRLYMVCAGGLMPWSDEPVEPPPPEELVFAAVGDVHGQHHRMVELVQQAASMAGVKVELVLQVGDFEAHRDEADLATMAAPGRFRRLGDFPDFHQQRSQFPWWVLHIGGNHEPYGYYDTLLEGGETAPDCRYLGRSGLRDYGSFRVAGLSGIYRQDQIDAHRPHVSAFATTGNKRFIGYTRDDLGRLMDLCEDRSPQVLLLHEWPRVALGTDELEQLRSFLKRQGLLTNTDDDDGEIDYHRLRSQDTVGSAEALDLAQLIEPGLVLCGHVHAPLRTTIPGSNGPIPVRALAKINAGFDAIALFHWSAKTGIVELSEWRPTGAQLRAAPELPVSIDDWDG